MLPIFALSFLLTAGLSGITTIPFVISILTVCAVMTRKSWVFFFAFFMGLFLDLSLLRPLGYTSLALVMFVFIIWLYERKFEIRTYIFVFLVTFIGSVFYLMVFEYNNVLLQSLVAAFSAIGLFVVIPNTLRHDTGERRL
jgi:cell shape-determining protein MreD